MASLQGEVNYPSRRETEDTEGKRLGGGEERQRKGSEGNERGKLIN